MSCVEPSFVHTTFWMNLNPIPTARPMPIAPRADKAIAPLDTAVTAAVADKDYATTIPLPNAVKVPKKIDTNDFPVSNLSNSTFNFDKKS